MEHAGAYTLLFGDTAKSTANIFNENKDVTDHHDSVQWDFVDPTWLQIPLQLVAIT